MSYPDVNNSKSYTNHNFHYPVGTTKEPQELRVFNLPYSYNCSKINNLAICNNSFKTLSSEENQKSQKTISASRASEINLDKLIDSMIDSFDNEDYDDNYEAHEQLNVDLEAEMLNRINNLKDNLDNVKKVSLPNKLINDDFNDLNKKLINLSRLGVSTLKVDDFAKNQIDVKKNISKDHYFKDDFRSDLGADFNEILSKQVALQNNEQITEEKLLSLPALDFLFNENRPLKTYGFRQESNMNKSEGDIFYGDSLNLIPDAECLKMWAKESEKIKSILGGTSESLGLKMYRVGTRSAIGNDAKNEIIKKWVSGVDDFITKQLKDQSILPNFCLVGYEQKMNSRDQAQYGCGLGKCGSLRDSDQKREIRSVIPSPKKSNMSEAELVQYYRSKLIEAINTEMKGNNALGNS